MGQDNRLEPPDDHNDDLERNLCQWCKYGPEICDKVDVQEHTEYGETYRDCMSWEDEEE